MDCRAVSNRMRVNALAGEARRRGVCQRRILPQRRRPNRVGGSPRRLRKSRSEDALSLVSRGTPSERPRSGPGGRIRSCVPCRRAGPEAANELEVPRPHVEVLLVAAPVLNIMMSRAWSRRPAALVRSMAWSMAPFVVVEARRRACQRTARRGDAGARRGARGVARRRIERAWMAARRALRVTAVAAGGPSHRGTHHAAWIDVATSRSTCRARVPRETGTAARRRRGS